MKRVKMYPKRILTYLTVVGLLFLLAGCETFREAQDSETFIFLKPDDTLYVRMVIASNLEMEQRYPDLTDREKTRRYEQYLASMRSLVQMYRLPVDVYLLERGEEPGDGPVLELFAIRWEQDRMGEISAVVRAKLERFGDLNTLGTFVQRETPSLMSTFERTEAAFARTMEGALSQMLVELNTHFETPAEEAFVEGQ